MPATPLSAANTPATPVAGGGGSSGEPGGGSPAIGVLLSLPLAAAYPVVERIWLKKYLGAKVVESHQALDNSANR